MISSCLFHCYRPVYCATLLAGDGHPEKIDRVTAVIDNFRKIDNKELIWKKPTKFDQSFLINTHSSEYIDLVNKSFPENGLAFLDGDTVYHLALDLLALF